MVMNTRQREIQSSETFLGFEPTKPSEEQHTSCTQQHSVEASSITTCENHIDNQRLLEITGVYYGLVEITGITGVTRDYWSYYSLLWITRDYWSLLWITRDYCAGDDQCVTIMGWNTYLPLTLLPHHHGRTERDKVSEECVGKVKEGELCSQVREETPLLQDVCMW